MPWSKSPRRRPPSFTPVAPLIGSLLALAAGTSAARAFPPAPFLTLYGMVRDDQGQAISGDGAEVVFLKDGAELLRTPIRSSRLLDQNYQLRLRMDMARPGTRSYSELAQGGGGAFSLGVVLHDVVYYPIEMSTPRSVGQPGQRVRLDLTLGEDSDGDGIPDAWEQSQLYAGGVLPGPDGWDLAQLTRDGDFDGDGISNWHEYIAGTFAADPTDHLALQIIEAEGNHSHLRFFAIYGKVYSLEISTDLQTWTAAPFFIRDPDSTDSDDVATPPAPQASVRAEATDFVDLHAPADATGRTFYRLKVR